MGLPVKRVLPFLCAFHSVCPKPNPLCQRGSTAAPAAPRPAGAAQPHYLDLLLVSVSDTERAQDLRHKAKMETARLFILAKKRFYVFTC